MSKIIHGDPAKSMPVSHAAARAAILVMMRALNASFEDPNFALIARYLSEREQGSRDMKSTIEAVIELFGPTGLIQIQRIVEEKRKLPEREKH
jgi:hypothetical protein